MDPLDLARWQFAITTVYHFLFVPLTIGLSFLVAGLQTAWVRTGPAAAAALTLAGAVRAAAVRREGWAFAGTATAIALTVASVFTAVDSLGGRPVAEAAASPYSLTVLSWGALLLAPAVLLYQGWTYWVFRRRVGLRDTPPH
jgi:cytochrome bd ubiquinol oxidase subunit II